MATDDRPQPDEHLSEETLPSLRPAAPARDSGEPATAGAAAVPRPFATPPPAREERAPAPVPAPSGSDVSANGSSSRSVKVGLLGGKQTGKSYLFQAMVYRTAHGGSTGALTYYTRGLPVTGATRSKEDTTWRGLDLVRLIEEYRRWLRLSGTTVVTETWYRLDVPYFTGWWGRDARALQAVFFDGSGDRLAGSMATDMQKVWQEAFLDAAVMVFCLPLWAAFPDLVKANGGRDAADRRLIAERDGHLLDFSAVVHNFRELRRAHGKETQPIRTVLALTMADDRRVGLDTVRDEWIEPYVNAPRRHLDAVGTGGGIVRYLAAARQVSEFLHARFAAAEDRVRGIPATLRAFDAGKPWIIPISAIDGARLETFITRPVDDPERSSADPVPAHVELPLLLALCESANALM